MYYHTLKEQSINNAGEHRKYAELYWEKVQEAEDDECWLWTASKDTTGRGSYPRGSRWIGSGTTPKIAYALHNQYLPKRNEYVYHTCGNKACVNPLHLYIGSYRERPGYDEWIQREEMKRGGRKPGSKFLGDDTEELVTKFYRHGYTYTEVHQRFGVSRYFQKQILRKRGIIS